MTLRKALFALAAVAATMTLSACVPGAAAGGSPTPTASPTSAPDPTPTPTPTPEPVAAAVTVSAEAIAVLDESGATLASYDYFTPTADVVSGLTVYLGTPVTGPYPGGVEMPPGTVHEWGGLTITDPDAPVAEPYYGDYWVTLTAADANGLPVGTPAGVGSPAGVHVGDPFTSVTILDEAVVEWSDADGHQKANTRIGLIPLPPGYGYGDEPSLGVTVVGVTDDDAVTSLIAPSRNWGP